MWQGFSGKCNLAVTPGSIIFKVNMIPEEMQDCLRHFHTWVTGKLTNQTPSLTLKAVIKAGLSVQKTENLD